MTMTNRPFIPICLPLWHRYYTCDRQYNQQTIEQVEHDVFFVTYTTAPRGTAGKTVQGREHTHTMPLTMRT